MSSCCRRRWSRSTTRPCRPKPADLAQHGPESRPPALADEPLQGYVGIASFMARASPRLKPLSRRCCRKRRAATDLYRRRRVTAQPRRPDRRRQQPAVREGRGRPRRGTDERSYRPGTGQARSAGARTRQRCRHRLGTAGFDRSHRAMGQGRRSPRHRAGADHRGRNQAEVELTQQDAQNAVSSVMGGHSRRRRRSLRSPIDPAIHVLF